jgi:nitrite reductase/ring-hydroxylating ferredoxin subunit
MSDRWFRVASVEDVPAGEVFRAETEGEEIVLANVDGDLYALEDRCSHEDMPLSSGDLDGNRLQCLYHGAEFDVCTGSALQLPAIRPVKSFETQVRDDGIYVLIP